MAAARGALKKNATMLYTASQAFLRHPDVAATRANRDYVFKQVQEAIAGISSAAQATSPTDEAKGHTGIGELAAALNEFDVSTKLVHRVCTHHMCVHVYVIYLCIAVYVHMCMKNAIIVYIDFLFLEFFDRKITYMVCIPVTRNLKYWQSLIY